MSEKKKEAYSRRVDTPHRYDYEFDLKGDNPGAIVTRLVKSGSRVLDIGAGPGSITGELKRNRDCHVTALDIDHRHVERLTESCDAAYQVDLNDPDWPRALENEDKFDVVIAADVLEHLWDPWKTLSVARKLIHDDGEIIISLPHVGHCVIAACLINGDFQYQDVGLLDKTHVRFFGLKNIQSLINDAGLNIVDAKFILRSPESTDLAQQWSRLSAETRQTLLSGKYSQIYQVIVKARNKSQDDKNIMLENLEIGKSRVGLYVRLVPNAAVRHFLKTRLKSLLSVESRRRLRKFAARIGVRF